MLLQPNPVTSADNYPPCSSNYSDLTGLQGFYPRRSDDQGERHDRTFVPLEVLLDSKCQSLHFDRVLPKTDGYFHYDKFNQLRLSNDLSVDREQYGQEALPEHIQHKQVSYPVAKR